MPTLEKRPTKTELRRGRGAAPRDGAARRSGAHQDDGVFGSLLTDSIHQSWFVSLGQQLSELFRGKRKLPRVRAYDRRALAASEEAGISQVGDRIRPRSLVPFAEALFPQPYAGKEASSAKA